MFESLEDMQGQLKVFLQDTREFTNVVCIEYIFTDGMIDETNIEYVKNEKQIKKLFWFLGFLFINMGERLALFERELSDIKIKDLPPIAKDLIGIRNNLSHKLYLIEPTQYKNFFKSLQKDLFSINFAAKDDEPSSFNKARLSSCKNYLGKYLKYSLDKNTLQALFFHWSEMYQLTYQDALTNKALPLELHGVALALRNSAVIANKSTGYSCLPIFSVIIILGQLSLRISQHLYPRDIQSARASRAVMQPLEQLLFDLQVIRNQLVHDMISHPKTILEDGALLTMFCSHMLEVHSKLRQQHSQKEFFSASSSYRFRVQPDERETVKVKVETEDMSAVEAKNTIRPFDKKKSKANRRNPLFALEFFDPLGDPQIQLTGEVILGQII